MKRRPRTQSGQTNKCPNGIVPNFYQKHQRPTHALEIQKVEDILHERECIYKGELPLDFSIFTISSIIYMCALPINCQLNLRGCDPLQLQYSL